MRLIFLLLALLIIGMLIYNQLGKKEVLDPNAISTESKVEAPKIPTSPKDLQKFKKDMNQYMKDVSENRAKEMEEALNQK